MTQRLTLATARKRRQPPMTQEQLAAAVDVDQTYISLIEAGKRHPSGETLKRLAKALGIAPSKLRFSAPEPVASVSAAKDREGHTQDSKTKSAVA